MSNQYDTPANTRWARFAATFALCAAFSLALYWRTIFYGFLSTDDLTYVVKNPLTARFDLPHLRRMFSEFYFTDYLPILQLFLAAERAVFGSPQPVHAQFDPSGYHAVSILLHALNGTLLFALLRALRPNFPAHPAAIFVGVVVFLAHPVHVENVAWIAQQKTLLSTALLLASMWSYISYIRNQKTLYYVLSLTAGACAPFTKASTIVLPLLLLLCDVLILRQSWRRSLARTIPFLAIAIAASITTIISQARSGAISFHQAQPPHILLLTIPPILVDYARMVIFPWRLAYFYHVPLRHSPLDASVLLSCSLLAAYGLCLWRLARRLNVLFWLLWPAVALAPVSNIVPLNTLMADRYLYLPLLGIAGLIVLGLDGIRRTDCLNARLWRLSLTTVAVALAMLCTLTINQTRWWRSDRAMWRHALIHAPQRWKPWHHAALATRNEAAALQQSNPDLAASLLHSTARTFRECLRRFGPDPRTLSALGSTLWDSGHHEHAILHWLESLRSDPGNATTHANLGVAYYRLGRIEQSIPHLLQATQAVERFPEVSEQIDVLNEILQKALSTRRPGPPPAP